MSEIIGSIYQGLNLILSFDKEVYEIIGLTLIVTILSTCIAALLGISSGVFTGSMTFAGRQFFIRLVHTFMGLPPVVAGLVVYIMLSRRGPLGGAQLLFTPTAMVIAQVIIVFPIICGLTIAAVRLKSRLVLETCRGLGFGKAKSMMMLIYECRYPIISALLAGYGRAISEVGAVMLVGGNIQNNTRVMTTAIVLETGKGNYDKALALGLILLTISFSINWLLQKFQEDV